MEIYPSITTTNSNWRNRIAEIKDFSLKEIGFFPTCLAKEERQESYDLLIKAGVKSIPFVHLRTDMGEDEIKYLISQFKTEVFNIHTAKSHQMDNDLSAFKNVIYIENQSHEFTGDELKNLAGVCIDFSHLENARLNKSPLYDYFMDIINKYPHGCAHINAIKNRFLNRIMRRYDCHSYNKLSDFDYLAKYKDFIPDISALELENSIAKQLKARDYIKKLLNA